jgi:hypothetical protein
VSKQNNAPIKVMIDGVLAATVAEVLGKAVVGGQLPVG